MNANSNISFEIALKSATQDRRARLGVFAGNRINISVKAAPRPAKPEKIEREERQEDWHVKTWNFGRVMSGDKMPMHEYFRFLCWLSGFSISEIKSQKRPPKISMVRRSIIRSIATQYPNMSMPAIGKIVGKDHSTVVYHLGNTRGKESGLSSVRTKVFRKPPLTRDMVLAIKARSKSGDFFKVIAKEFGVSGTTVSEIAHGKFRWSADE